MYHVINYFKLFKEKDFIIYGLCLIIFPFLVTVDANFINILLSSNYVTLIINVYFLVLMYKIIQSMNRIKLQTITRLGMKKTKLVIHIFASICTLAYSLSLYIYLFLIYGNSNYNTILLVLLLFNTFIYLLEVNIMFLQFNRKNNAIFIIIPITINFLFHYMLFV